MKKNILIIVIITLIILVLSAGVIILSKKEKEVKLIEEQGICEKINNSKKNKQNFLIVVTNKQTAPIEAQEVMEKIKIEYKDIITYEIEPYKMNDKCFEHTLKDTGLYTVLKENKTVAVVTYKDGIYNGVTENETSYYRMEDYLSEQGVINKKEIKEEITYDDYLKKIESEEYLLLIITEEDTRKKVSENMKKTFPNIKQNTVNYRSKIGEKILADIENKTKIDNMYPRIFYFKNGKLITNKDVFSENSFSEFKSMIK